MRQRKTNGGEKGQKDMKWREKVWSTLCQNKSSWWTVMDGAGGESTTEPMLQPHSRRRHIEELPASLPHRDTESTVRTCSRGSSLKPKGCHSTSKWDQLVIMSEAVLCLKRPDDSYIQSSLRGMSRIYATFLQYYATHSKWDLWIDKKRFCYVRLHSIIKLVSWLKI